MTSETPPSSKQGALGQKYIDPGHRQGPVSRQTIVLAGLVVAILFTNKAVDVLGTDADILLGAGATLVAVGAIGGAFFHPVRRFWWRGSISGVAVAAGAFAAHRLYSRWRPDPFGHEFAIVALLGAVPGVILYDLLMRGQTVAGGRDTSTRPGAS